MPKLDVGSVLLYLLLAVVILTMLGLMAVYFYAVIVYGNTPIAECPVWVVWLLGIGR